MLLQTSFTVTMVLTVHLLAVFVSSCVFSCVCSSVSCVSSSLESGRGIDKNCLKFIFGVFHINVLVGSAL